MRPTANVARYPLLDRRDPDQPCWVIAEARRSRPAEVPRRLAGPDLSLANVDHDHLPYGPPGKGSPPGAPLASLHLPKFVKLS